VERVLDDPARAAALIASGGRLERHSVIMVLGLAEAAPSPPLAAGFSVAPMDPDRLLEYGEVVRRAYPPEHPDHEPSDSDAETVAAALSRCVRGEEIGPWISEASWHVVDHAASVVGLIVVNETSASDAFAAGPFVTDLCIDPTAAGHGLGSALLSTSVRSLAELGWTTLILVVTVGNPAQRVYERLGFRVTVESWRIRTAD
jgi:ribosomal protein S18 acetylase RimI-like enzyme